MAVTTDIARTWRGPAKVMQDLVAQGKREDRAIAYLMIACLIIFISRLPAIQYDVVQSGGDFQRDASYAFLSLIMFMPLILYGVAAVLHLVCKVFGGKGSFYTARLALFWSLLASTPALLLYGLTRGLIGPGIEADITGAIWVIGFLWFLIQTMRVAERADA